MNPSNIIPLEALEIANPCKADWNAMVGDNRARFCGTCHKHVYDFSQMTRAEAEALILEKEGVLCARLHRRSDGTVITTDCPIGTIPPRRRLWWVGAAVSALFGAFVGLAGRPVQARPTSSQPVNTTSMVAGGLVAYPVPTPRVPGGGSALPPVPKTTSKSVTRTSMTRKSRAKKLARRITTR